VVIGGKEELSTGRKRNIEGTQTVGQHSFQKAFESRNNASRGVEIIVSRGSGSRWGEEGKAQEEGRWRLAEYSAIWQKVSLGNPRDFL